MALTEDTRRAMVTRFQREEEGWLARFLWRESVVASVRRGDSAAVAEREADKLCAAWRARFGTTEVDPSGVRRFGDDNG